jgi:hypothetical protein
MCLYMPAQRHRKRSGTLNPFSSHPIRQPSARRHREVPGATHGSPPVPHANRFQRSDRSAGTRLAGAQCSQLSWASRHLRRCSCGSRIGRRGVMSWAASDCYIRRALQKSPGARTATPPLRGDCGRRSVGRSSSVHGGASCLLSLKAAALRKRPSPRLHDRARRSNSQRFRRCAAAPAQTQP